MLHAWTCNPKETQCVRDASCLDLFPLNKLCMKLQLPLPLLSCKMFYNTTTLSLPWTRYHSDYDGGDCCSCTCVDDTYSCGLSGFDCQDPNTSCNGSSGGSGIGQHERMSSPFFLQGSNLLSTVKYKQYLGVYALGNGMTSLAKCMGTVITV